MAAAKKEQKMLLEKHKDIARIDRRSNGPMVGMYAYAFTAKPIPSSFLMANAVAATQVFWRQSPGVIRLRRSLARYVVISIS